MSLTLAPVTEKFTADANKDIPRPPSRGEFVIAWVGIGMAIIVPILFLSPLLRFAPKVTANPILVATLLTIIGTFLYRGLWTLCINRSKSCRVRGDNDPFKPERTIFLAGAIFTLAAVLFNIPWISSYFTVPFKGGQVDNWLITLLLLVPLAEVYGGSWRKLKAVKETNQGLEEISWPRFPKKN